MKKFLCVILALVFSLSILTSCGNKDTSGKSFAMAVSVLPKTFDPQIAATTTEKTIALNCFDTLFRPDENGNLQCLSAESYSVSADGLVYTIKIHQGLKYFVSESAKTYISEKGGDIPQTVTAKDFAFGITRAILPETQAADYILVSAIKNADAVHNGELTRETLGIETPDDYTLKITLERADSNFLFALSQCVTAPCNEKFFNLTAGRYGLEPKYTISNGAFFISSAITETSVSITKNAEYSGVNVAVPASVTFYLNTDFSQIGTKLKKGNYDCAFVPSQTVSAVGDKTTKIGINNITYSLVFNYTDERFSSVSLRRGLVSAIDYSTLGVTLADGLVSNHYKLADNEINNSAVSKPSLNVENARKSVTEAFSELEISKISIKLICTEETQSIAQKVISSWQKNIGVELNGTLSVLSKEDFESAIAKKEFDMAVYPVSIDTGNAVEFMSCFKTDDKDNILKYSSEEYDRIFDTLNESPTNENLSLAQSFLIQNAVVTPIYFDSQYFVLAKGVSEIYYVSDTANVYFYKGRK